MSAFSAPRARPPARATGGPATATWVRRSCFRPIVGSSTRATRRRASKVTVAGVELDISPSLARKLTKTEQDAIPKLSRAAIILLLNSKPGKIGKVDYYAGSEQGEGIEAYNVLASTGLMAKTDLDPSKCDDDFKKQAGDKTRCFEVVVTDAGGRFREFLSDVIAEKLNLTE